MTLTLVAAYPLYANAANSNILTTPSFTPANGDILVAKLATWDTNTPITTTNTGSQTFNPVKVVAPGGFNQFCALYAATVSGSPGSMTVSTTAPINNSYHSMVLEQWAGGVLAATPAVNVTQTGSGVPSSSITTTAPNSIVTSVSGDANSKPPSGRLYLGSATEDGLQDGSTGSNSVSYFYYQSAASAGAQTVGMSAPLLQQWVLAAMEIKELAAAPPASFQGWGVPI
jgi:hypothetical protein